LDRRAEADHTEIMTSDDAILWRKWERDGRLTPWLVHDLPRIAWIVESRTSELTDEERQIVRDAVTRMQRALDQTTA
jgi:hypothetical protein